MLAALAIRDFVLIDQLDLELDQGLNVMTGETGAGKSILLDALQFVMGGRTDRDTVRTGAAMASVTAVLEPPETHPIRQMLADNGFPSEGQILLRRQLTSDGRGRAHINDQPASAGLLRMAGEALIEIHGQHDDRGLLNPASHRALTDLHGGLGAQAAAVSLAFEAWRAAESETDAARKAMADAAREHSFLEHAAAELTSLDPQDGEETELASQRTFLMSAEKISADLAEAIDALSGQHGVDAKLNLALRRLARAKAFAQGKLDGAIAAVERASADANEARVATEAAARAFGADGRRLEAIEQRLFALRAAARKYLVPCDALPRKLASFTEQLATITGGSQKLAQLEAAAAEARTKFETLARALSAARIKAGQALDIAVAAELAPLKLDKAQFKTQVDTIGLDQAGAGGLDRVAFTVSTNPGAPFGALNKIASGGELSRFFLALKVALAAQGEAQTLIFDEVDRGVGGAVADAVGERLARLAQGVQVLAVTHAPQVAARAAHHFRVEKAMRGGAMRTIVTRLSRDERIEEVARMLAGASVTEPARAAARALMAAGEAAPPAAPKRKKGRA
jgi:DNA repair protein RecN (Recombination protein N)